MLDSVLSILAHEGYVTSISVLVGVAGWLISLNRSIAIEKRQHTLRFMLSLKENDGLRQADAFMATQIASGSPLEEGNITFEDDTQVITLLDFYELICTSARRGYLDMGAVKHLRGAAMAAAMDVSETYIKARRQKLSRPELYQSFEWFVARHAQRAKVKRQWTSPVAQPSVGVKGRSAEIV